MYSFPRRAMAVSLSTAAAQAAQQLSMVQTPQGQRRAAPSTPMMSGNTPVAKRPVGRTQVPTAAPRAISHEDLVLMVYTMNNTMEAEQVLTENLRVCVSGHAEDIDRNKALSGLIMDRAVNLEEKTTRTDTRLGQFETYLEVSLQQNLDRVALLDKTLRDQLDEYNAVLNEEKTLNMNKLAVLTAEMEILKGFVNSATTSAPMTATTTAGGAATDLKVKIIENVVNTLVQENIKLNGRVNEGAGMTAQINNILGGANQKIEETMGRVMGHEQALSEMKAEVMSFGNVGRCLAAALGLDGRPAQTRR